MSKYMYLNQDEVVSHIEKFGTDEEKILLDKLYIMPEEISWEDCPNCDDTDRNIQRALEKIEEGLEMLG